MQMLPIELTPMKMQILRVAPFSWASFSSLQYLGIQLPSPSEDLFQSNCTALLSKLTQLNANLQPISSSWAGRIALVKMFMLPHVLCLFRTFPIPFLSANLKKIQVILNSLIWKGKCPCIKSTTFLWPAKALGLGAPNITVYYKAFILAQMKMWWNPTFSLSWIQRKKTAMESDLKCALAAKTLQPDPTHHALATITAASRVRSSLLEPSLLKGPPENSKYHYIH